MKFLLWCGLIAFLLSAIFGFYHFTIPSLFKIAPYSPLALNSETSSLSVDETIAYAPKVQEILNGHIALSDAFIWEYKNYASPLRGEIVPAIIMAGLAKIGGGVDKAFILADFIFPPIVFLLLVRFFGLIGGKKYFSVAAALIVMFFYNYFRLFPYLPSALLQIFQSLNNGYPSPFLRSFHPQISFPFFILGIITLWQKRWINLGLTLGLLFYTDFFYWTFMLAFTALTGLKNREFVKSLILGLVPGLPYFLNAFRFQSLPLSQSFITNLTFKPEAEILPLIVMLTLLLLAKWGLRNKALSVFWQLYYAAMIVVLLGSKLLNFSLDDPVGHWRLRIIYPLTLGFILLLINQWLKIKKTFWIALAVLLLVYQSRVHWQFFHKKAASFYIEPEKLEVFNWINRNTANDSVVLTTSLKDNLYLTIFTHANVFIPRSQHSLAPADEALERFLILYKAAGVPAERVQTMLSLTEANLELKAKGRFNFDDCGGHYLYFRRFIGNDYYNCSVPEEKLAEILEQYETLQPDLTKYRADYWLGAEPVAFGRLVWENSAYKIYALR